MFTGTLEVDDVLVFKNLRTLIQNKETNKQNPKFLGTLEVAVANNNNKKLMMF